jgi:hypothetical protein
MAATAARAAAPATAPRRSTPRRKPAPRRTPPARRSTRTGARTRGRTPARGFAAPVHLVGRTAVAVGDLADSGLVVRMTRSRTWIGVLGVLLAGIVALNVVSLSLTASSGKVAARSEALQQQNAVLRSQLTERLSSKQVQEVALGLGLSVPEPQEIEYLRAGDEYAAAAAKRIEQGGLVASGSAPVATEETVPVTATEPVVPVPTEPVPAEPVPAP